MPTASRMCNAAVGVGFGQAMIDETGSQQSVFQAGGNSGWSVPWRESLPFLGEWI